VAMSIVGAVAQMGRSQQSIPSGLGAGLTPYSTIPFHSWRFENRF